MKLRQCHIIFADIAKELEYVSQETLEKLKLERPGIDFPLLLKPLLSSREWAIVYSIYLQKLILKLLLKYQYINIKEYFYVYDYIAGYHKEHGVTNVLLMHNILSFSMIKNILTWLKASGVYIPIFPYDKKKIQATGKTKTLGPYEILHMIGEGGMGIVYKARHETLQNIVALKKLNLETHDTIRFKQEAHITSYWKHPNIVSVLDAGVDRDTYYIVMPFIEGKTLSEHIKTKDFNIRKAFLILKDIASGIAYAHKHQVVHRDIKPSNIIIDTTGKSMIMDFGIAKDLEKNTALTQEKAFMGTLEYMAPEQTMDSGKIDKRADVYSLGAVLYRMIVGKPVFTGKTSRELLHKVLFKDPISPRKINPKIALDAEIICMKALAKEKQYRYKNAESLKRDIERYLRGEAIEARKFHVGYYLWCKIRKYPKVFTGILFLFLCLTFYIGYWRVQKQKERRKWEQLTKQSVQKIKNETKKTLQSKKNELREKYKHWLKCCQKILQKFPKSKKIQYAYLHSIQNIFEYTLSQNIHLAEQIVNTMKRSSLGELQPRELILQNQKRIRESRKKKRQWKKKALDEMLQTIQKKKKGDSWKYVVNRILQMAQKKRDAIIIRNRLIEFLRKSKISFHVTIATRALQYLPPSLESANVLIEKLYIFDSYEIKKALSSMGKIAVIAIHNRILPYVSLPKELQNNKRNAILLKMQFHSLMSQMKNEENSSHTLGNLCASTSSKAVRMFLYDTLIRLNYPLKKDFLVSLTLYLDKTDRIERQKIANIFSLFHSKDTLVLFEKFANSKYLAIQKGAIAALGNIKSQKALKTLLKLSAIPTLQQECFSAFLKIGTQKAFQYATLCYQDSFKISKETQHSLPFQQYILNVLKSKEHTEKEKIKSIKLIERLKLRRSIPLLCKYINEKQLQIPILKVLNSFKDLKTVNIFASFVKSKNRTVRTISILSLGKLRQRTFLTQLIELLSSSPFYILKAAKVLENWKNPFVAKKLINILERSKADPKLQLIIIGILGNMGKVASPCFPILEKFLWHNSRYMQIKTMETLMKLDHLKSIMLTIEEIKKKSSQKYVIWKAFEMIEKEKRTISSPIQKKLKHSLYSYIKRAKDIGRFKCYSLLCSLGDEHDFIKILGLLDGFALRSEACHFFEKYIARLRKSPFKTSKRTDIISSLYKILQKNIPESLKVECFQLLCKISQKPQLSRLLSIINSQSFSPSKYYILLDSLEKFTNIEGLVKIWRQKNLTHIFESIVGILMKIKEKSSIPVLDYLFSRVKKRTQENIMILMGELKYYKLVRYFYEYLIENQRSTRQKKILQLILTIDDTRIKKDLLLLGAFYKKIGFTNFSKKCFLHAEKIK